MWDKFPPEARKALAERGVFARPSAYGESYPMTAKLIEDGRRHLMLHRGQDCPCPVRILQGDQDQDVPAPHAVKTFEALRGADIALTYQNDKTAKYTQPLAEALGAPLVTKPADVSSDTVPVLHC